MKTGHPPRILLVNAYNRWLDSIPMGTFGLCDYLARNGISAKILNLSLYPKEEILERLQKTVNRTEPTMIGIVIHWKETLSNALALAKFLKGKFQGIPIVAGGITAGYLGKDLLQQCPEIDFIIRGDAEVPLLKLARSYPPSIIPNLIYRNGGKVIASSRRFSISKQLLNKLSFSNLTYLIDFKYHLKKATDTIGFPIFIGRGCVYNCCYCGGNRSCFIKHSNRNKPVTRSIGAVLRDLKSLLAYTNNIFICYEIQKKYIHALFKAIAADRCLARKFRLNYGTWGLVNEQWLGLYAKAFDLSSRHAPFIEISPETSIDSDRKLIRDPGLSFTNGQLKKCLDDIFHTLGDRVTVKLFYSRYHKTQSSRLKLMRELDGIDKMRYYIEAKGYEGTTIIFETLSTDPGTTYWDLAFKRSGFKSETRFLTEHMEYHFLKHERYNSEFTNLCVYLPPRLNEKVAQRLENALG